jgi:hypothetical protein
MTRAIHLVPNISSACGRMRVFAAWVSRIANARSGQSNVIIQSLLGLNPLELNLHALPIPRTREYDGPKPEA